ncbi:effector-associated domain EAD1-containing protein [Streptomyces parvulus]|uniref:effector-associated domain EAD1-containing protein n=1 Tax=Streptomyces parvulus TaxID=146923 RepID=UPI0033A30401
MPLLLDQPFFDSADPRACELLDVLLRVYDAKDAVRRFAESAGLLTAAIDWDGPMADVWPRVLEHAASARKLRRLVEVVSEDPNSGAYEIFKLLLNQEPPAMDADPFGALLVGGGRSRAFIDRAELREVLREMLHTEGGKVLIVEGDPRSGKTWTWHLLCHVLGNRRIVPYKIDLTAYEPPVEVHDIVAALEDQIGWSMDEVDVYGSEDAKVRRLVNLTKQRTRALTEDHWLVFDGLAATDLAPPALRLVERLAEAVADGEMGTHMHMVLIAYDGQLQPSIDPYVWRTRLRPICVGDLHEFFCAIAKRAGGELAPKAADLLVNDVLREVFVSDYDHAVPLPLDRISHVVAHRGRSLLGMYGGTGG